MTLSQGYALPPDEVLSLLGDSTLTLEQGRKPPLDHVTRHGEHDPYLLGFEPVLLIASCVMHMACP